MNTSDNHKRLSLGMDSFEHKSRHKFGQQVRLAMAFMDGSASTPPDDKRPESAMPRKAPAIARRLKVLGQDITSNMADQIELLVRFNELEGWRASGARHCAAWMNVELGIGPSLAWEYLRVGVKLRKLPITTALFRAGRLNWSKVRLLSRVATAENEGGLCHAALDASVTDVARFCSEYRWDQHGNDDDEDSGDASETENARYLQQHDARSFSWNQISNGNTQIRLSLPPEVAQAFLNSVEHSLEQLELNDDTMSQRRADAAVLMAETSLQLGGKSVSTADRYQVIVSVDASELSNEKAAKVSAKSDARAFDSATPEHETVSAESGAIDSTTDVQALSAAVPQIPAKRPTVQRTNPIAQETARRIACDCSVSTISMANGEPVSIGRKSRLWPPAMARAIKTRDQHCQYPGCDQTRHLHIHHINHWADGGETSIDNGVCLCHAHHILVHEGGYSIERITARERDIDQERVSAKRPDNTLALEEQFFRQSSSHSKNATCEKVEAALRDSRESFDYVRALLPTRFRFRVLDSAGNDVRDGRDTVETCNSGSSQTCADHNNIQLADNSHDESLSAHSTRVECEGRNGDNGGKYGTHGSGVQECPAAYHVHQVGILSEIPDTQHAY